jgi:carboxymethylenebutenolidase
MNDIKQARRSVLKGLGGLSLTGFPLAAVLADAGLARAAAAGLETVSLTTSTGETQSAALALPAVTPAPSVLLVHEWWGLNDQIKSVARALADEGYVALAIDLYDGKVTTNSDDARRLMGQVQGPQATATLDAWIDWLQARADTTAKLGTVGWCFGGGWSLNASLARPVDATVIYYGRLVQDKARLAALKGPVLGHYASRDQWIDQKMVAGFESAMTAANRPYVSHWYEADHAFANPTSARYDEADAALAWRRTLAFFKAKLG